MSSSSPKSRVISHMNSDHQRALSLYLQHYRGVPASQASANPQLVDISLDSMTILLPSSGSTHVITFSPALGSLEHAREQLVAMANEARAALGLGDVDVRGFAWPHGFDLVPFCGIGLFYFCAATLPRLVDPQGRVWSLLQAWFPGGAGGFEWLVNTIFWPVIVIHVVEAWWFDRTRCARFGVPRFSPEWWLWEWACFMEGYTSFKRFDGLVEKTRKRKEEGGRKEL